MEEEWGTHKAREKIQNGHKHNKKNRKENTREISEKTSAEQRKNRGHSIGEDKVNANVTKVMVKHTQNKTTLNNELQFNRESWKS